MVFFLRFLSERVRRKKNEKFMSHYFGISEKVLLRGRVYLMQELIHSRRGRRVIFVYKLWLRYSILIKKEFELFKDSHTNSL